MLMLSDMSLLADHLYACDIDVPAIDSMTLRGINDKALLVRASFYDLHLREANALFIARCSGYTRHHHKLNQLLRLDGQFPPLGLFGSVFRTRDAFIGETFKELHVEEA